MLNQAARALYRRSTKPSEPPKILRYNLALSLSMLGFSSKLQASDSKGFEHN